MGEKPIFKYFTGNEADQFTFYRIPKLLFTNKYFSGLSTDAKVLYGLMLDRIGLSVKNGWMDEQNRAYIYFSVEDTMEFLNCKKNKAIATIAELDVKDGIGLIEKKRQGQGKPTRIYVKSFYIQGDKAEISGSEVEKTNFKRFEKSTSKGLENKPQEVGKINPNKNNNNNTDFNDNKSNLIIATNGEKRFADMDEVKEILKRLESKGASILIGNGKYMVIFNDDKTFEQITGKFLVGSMLVMTIEDDVLSLIPDDELEVVMDLLESRMVTMVNDGERFSALEIL